MEVERTTQGRKAEKTPSVSPEPQNNCPVSQWVRRWQGSSGQGSVAWLGPGKQPDRSLILSRSKFLQGTAWNLTLVGAGGEGGEGKAGRAAGPVQEEGKEKQDTCPKLQRHQASSPRRTLVTYTHAYFSPSPSTSLR